MISVAHNYKYLSLIYAVALLTMTVGGVTAEPQRPSPDGGGWLEISKSGGYAYADDHPDFDENLVDGGTIDLWFYMPRKLDHLEGWTLFYKPGAYSVVILGWIPLPNDPERERRCECVGVIYLEHRSATGAGGRSGTLVGDSQVPINRWNRLRWVFQSGYATLYVNDERLLDTGGGVGIQDTDYPLYVGGSPDNPFFNDFYLRDVEWTQYQGGLIDGVTVSNRTMLTPNPADEFWATWRFDGLDSTTVTDSSRNSHRLHLVDARVQRAEFTPADRVSLAWGALKRDAR